MWRASGVCSRGGRRADGWDFLLLNHNVICQIFDYHCYYNHQWFIIVIFYHYHHCHHCCCHHCHYHFKGKCECLSAFIVKSDRTCVDRTVRWRDQYGDDNVDMVTPMIMTTNDYDNWLFLITGPMTFYYFHWQGWGATKSWSWGRRVQWCGQWPFHPRHHSSVIIVIKISSL